MADASDPTDFGMRLPYLLRRVNTALSQRLDRDLKPFALTQAQLSALALLAHEHPHGLSGAELAQRSGLTAQAMHTAVTDLVARGLVQRSPHPTHGRIIEAHITDAGHALVREVQQTTHENEARYNGGLDVEQQDQLRALLRQMVVNLGLYLPESPAVDVRRPDSPEPE